MINPCAGKDLCLPQTKLQYTAAVELNNYLDLLLNIQTLQCQRHLLSVLVADTLPWLEKLDCGHRSVCSLLVNVVFTFHSQRHFRTIFISKIFSSFGAVYVLCIDSIASYRRQLGSLSLCLCNIFLVLIISLVCYLALKTKITHIS